MDNRAAHLHGSARLEALDVFRGLTVAGMILVSTPGTWEAVYPALDHAPWNGWTPTDLVFPFLLFAMGAAVPFALARRRGSPRVVRRHVIRRGVILFALGLLLNAIEAKPPLALATFRLPGVLQRIAIVYVAVAWITERLSTRAQVGVAAAALMAYWIALVAGPMSAERNLGAVIDQHVFGRHMLYPQWDPEGLLSSVPAIATALCGVFAGDWLKRGGTTRRTLWLAAAGAASTLVALIWRRALPFNKNLWTSSFALFTAGLATQVLALCHWIIDLRAWRTWSHPFIAFGRNPLAAYFLSVGLDAVLIRWRVAGAESLKSVLYQRGFASWLKPCCGAEGASLGYAIAYVAVWGVVLVEMYRRRIFIGI